MKVIEYCPKCKEKTEMEKEAVKMMLAAHEKPQIVYEYKCLKCGTKY